MFYTSDLTRNLSCKGHDLPNPLVNWVYQAYEVFVRVPLFK